MPDPSRPLDIGDIIHGFAEGAFGRDSYDCKIIEAVGPDWIVLRDEDGYTYHAHGRGDLERCQRSRTPWMPEEGPCCDFGKVATGLTTWGRS